MSYRYRLGQLLIALAIASASLATQNPSVAQQTPGTQCIASATAGGTVNAITIPALPCALTTNLLILASAGSNTSTTPTLQPLGLAARTIVRPDGTALANGDTGPSGYRMLLNPNGVVWYLLNPFGYTPSSALPAITTSQIYGGTGSAGVAQAFPLGANVSTFLQTPSSANLLAAMTTETGSGLNVFNSSPTFAGTVVEPDSGTYGSGGINGSAIGATTPSTGAFTTLAASSTVSGTGFSTYLASPPGIGGTAAGAGAFTTLSASSTVSGTGFSTYLASPPAIGGTSAAGGAFTTLSASSTVSGSGFSTYLASPPAIGGTSAAAGSFTILTPTTGLTGNTSSSSAQSSPYVGQVLTASASAQAISNTTATNVTSLSLPAGHWSCMGWTYTNPAGTTTQTADEIGLNTVTATIPGTGGAVVKVTAVAAAGVNAGLNVGPVYYNQTGSQTIYLNALVSYSVSTLTIDGGIQCQRIW